MTAKVVQLSEWVQQDVVSYKTYFDDLVHSGELYTFRQGKEETWERAGEMWDEGVAGGMIAYAGAGLTSVLYHMVNTFSGGYADTRDKGVRAFEHGDISMLQLNQL